MRERVNAAIKAAFIKEFPGMEYRNDFIVYANSNLKLPCVWQTPLVLTNKTGRSQGFFTYRAEVYILEKIAKNNDKKEQRWGEIEQAAIKAIASIYREGGGEMKCENIKCTPDEFTATGYQTLTMSITFDLTAAYYEC